MKQTAIRRLERIEDASNIPPQTHLLWRDLKDDDAAIAQRIADMKVCGRAKESDQFVTVGWRK
jgi:hypothetical protein